MGGQYRQTNEDGGQGSTKNAWGTVEAIREDLKDFVDFSPGYIEKLKDRLCFTRDSLYITEAEFRDIVCIGGTGKLDSQPFKPCSWEKGFNEAEIKRNREEYSKSCEQRLEKQVEKALEYFEVQVNLEQEQDQDNKAPAGGASPKKASGNQAAEAKKPQSQRRILKQEWLTFVALMSKGTLKQRLEMIFGLYDFDKSRNITAEEFTDLSYTCFQTLFKMATTKDSSDKDEDNQDGEDGRVGNSSNHKHAGLAKKKERQGKKMWAKVGEALKLRERREALFNQGDNDEDNVMTFNEFYSLVRYNKDISNLLYDLGLAKKEDLPKDLTRPVDGIAEFFFNEDLENETRVPDIFQGDRRQRAKYDTTNEGLDDTFRASLKEDKGFRKFNRELYEEEKEDADTGEAKAQESELNSQLELEYIYGYRCKDVRNNLRYTEEGKIVFHAAGAGIVMNQNLNKQKFMLEHDDDIISLATSYNGRLCATGQAGEVPLICIWNTSTMECLAQIKGPLSMGIRHLCFSNDEKYLAASGMGVNQNIAIWSLYNDQKKLEPKCLVTQCGSERSPIWSLGFSATNGSSGNSRKGWDQAGLPELVATGTGEINFYQLELNAKNKEWRFNVDRVAFDTPNKHQDGVESNQLRRIFTAHAFVKSFLFVGDHTGNILSLLCKNGSHLVVPFEPEQFQPEASKAAEKDGKDSKEYRHTEVIYSMSARKKKPGFVSGSSDGKLISWLVRGVDEKDETVEVSVDNCFSLSNRDKKNEEAKGGAKDEGQESANSQLPDIKSVVEHPRVNKFLVGTKGGEIYEITPKDKTTYTSQCLLKSHYQGRLNGLVPIESSQASGSDKLTQFYSAGQDGVLALWDASTHQQLSFVKLETGAHVVERCSISMDNILVVGLDNGYVQFMLEKNPEQKSRAQAQGQGEQSPLSFTVLHKHQQNMHSKRITSVAFKTCSFQDYDHKVRCQFCKTFQQAKGHHYSLCAVGCAQGILSIFLIYQKTPSQVKDSGKQQDGSPTKSKDGRASGSGSQKQYDYKVVKLVHNKKLYENPITYVEFSDGPSLPEESRRDEEGSGQEDSDIYLRANTADNKISFFKLELKDKYIGFLLEVSEDQNKEDQSKPNESAKTNKKLKHQQSLLSSQRSQKAGDRQTGSKAATGSQEVVKPTKPKLTNALIDNPELRNKGEEKKVSAQGLNKLGQLIIKAVQQKEGHPVNSKYLKQKKLLSQLNWPDNSSKLSRDVQGIYNSYLDVNDVTSIIIKQPQYQGSKKQELASSGLMATGDIYGRVSLYNYPSTSHNAIRKIYLGHSSEVTNVQFVGKDTLLSAGGEDLSIFQWGIKHEPVEEKKRGKEKGKGTNQRSKRARRVNDIGLEDEVNQDAERPEKVRAQGEEEHDQKVKEATPYHYDEKEKKPEGHQPKAKGDHDQARAGRTKADALKKGSAMARTKKPAQKLELKHVHGFNNFPNGVRYLVDNTGDNTNESQKKATESGAKNGKRRIIFTLGSLGVIQDTANKTGHEQEFFDDHSSRITAMAVHPNGRYVATGQKAPEKGFAQIFVWDVETRETLREMQPFHTHGIQLLEFSPNGSKLLTVGQGPHNTVAVYDWTNSIVSTQCRTGTSRIKSASWENEQEFTIVSDYDPHKRSSNTKFYRIQGKNLSLKVGERLGSENVKPAGSKDEDKQEDLDFNTVVTHAQVSKTLRFCVTGTKKGYLYFWHDPQGKDKTKEKGSMTKVHRQILERKTKKDAAGKAIDSDRDWQDDECQKHRYGGVTCLSYLDNESKFIIGTDKGYVLSLDYVFDVNQEDITKQDCLDFSKLTEYKGPESFNNKPILSLQYLRGNGKSKERLLVATGEQRVVEYSANEMHEFAEDEKSSNSLGVKELVNGHDQSAVKSKSSEGQTKREQTIPAGVTQHVTKPCFATFGADRKVRIWQENALLFMTTCSLDTKKDTKGTSQLIGTEEPDLSAIAWHPDPSYMLAGDVEGTVHSYYLSAEGGQKMKRMDWVALKDGEAPPLGDNRVDQLCISPDGQFVAWSFAGDFSKVKVRTFSTEESGDRNGHDNNTRGKLGPVASVSVSAEVNPGDFDISTRLEYRTDPPTQNKRIEWVRGEQEEAGSPYRLKVQYYNEEKPEKTAVFHIDVAAGTITPMKRAESASAQANGDQPRGTGDLRAFEYECDARYKLGQDRQGIWRGQPKSEITASSVSTQSVEESSALGTIVTGDKSGSVRLYSHPCPTVNAKYREYLGHSAAVVDAVYTTGTLGTQRDGNDDAEHSSMLVTMSDEDQAIFVWVQTKTDERDVSDDDEGQLTRTANQEERQLASQDCTRLDKQALKAQVHERLAGILKRRYEGTPEDALSVLLRWQKEGLALDGREKGTTTSTLHLGSGLGLGLSYFERHKQDWKATVRTRFDYAKPVNQELAPFVDVKIDWVHGYRGFRGSHNNIGFLENDCLCYHAAALGIVYNPDPAAIDQNHFPRHRDEITCMAFAQDGKTVATGEQGEEPSIYVWNAVSFLVLREFKGTLKNGISCLAFSPSGSYLAAADNSAYHRVAVFNLTNGELKLSVNASRDFISEIAFKDDKEFSTLGEGHLQYWNIVDKKATGYDYEPRVEDAGGAVGAAGLSGTQKTMVYDYDAEVLPRYNDRSDTKEKKTALYTGHKGDKGGFLLRWDTSHQPPRVEFKIDLHEEERGGLKDEINSIVISSSFILVGGKDGRICLLDKKTIDCHSRGEDGESQAGQTLKDVEIFTTICLQETFSKLSLSSPQVVALAFNEEHKRLAIGLRGSQLLQCTVNHDSIKGFSLEVDDECAVVTQGHDFKEGRRTSEVLGLCLKPDNVRNTNTRKGNNQSGKQSNNEANGEFITTAEDGFIKIFNPEKRRVVKTIAGVKPKLDKYNVTVIDMSPCGSVIATGTQGGAIHLYSIKDKFEKAKVLYKLGDGQDTRYDEGSQARQDKSIAQILKEQPSLKRVTDLKFIECQEDPCKENSRKILLVAFAYQYGDLIVYNCAEQRNESKMVAKLSPKNDLGTSYYGERPLDAPYVTHFDWSVCARIIRTNNSYQEIHYYNLEVEIHTYFDRARAQEKHDRQQVKMVERGEITAGRETDYFEANQHMVIKPNLNLESVDFGRMKHDTVPDVDEKGRVESQECGCYGPKRYLSSRERALFVGKVDWNTNACVLNWQTVGAWRDSMDLMDMNACDISKWQHPDGYHLLATAEDEGSIKLYRAPSTEPDSKYLQLRGHSSSVTNVKFIGLEASSETGQERGQRHLLFSCGGNDCTVIQWRIQI